MGLVAVVVPSLVYLLVMPRWRYRIHRWEVTDDAVYAASGWIWQQWRVAPMSRIQTVDTVRGPLQQLFDLSGVTFAALILYGLVHTYTVRYRLADERLEMRSGVVFRRHRSIPRDRIRTVDLTAGPLNRIFGVSVVTVGTGQTKTDAENPELKLDGSRTPYAASHAPGRRRVP